MSIGKECQQEERQELVSHAEGLREGCCPGNFPLRLFLLLMATLLVPREAWTLSQEA